MPNKRGKILVIRGGAIGDFILTLPAIAALRETFPDTQLELVGYPRVAELARAAGIIDDFRNIEARPLAQFFARNAALDQDWSDYFETCNLIISYLFDPDEIFRTNLARASAAQFIQAQHRPDESQPIHASEVFLKPLEKIAIFGADPIPKLRITTNTSLAAGKWIAAHPGSGSEKKNWPEERWLELMQLLIASTDAHLLILGGEAEGARLVRLADALPAPRIRLAQNLPLLELAGLISQCAAFIGHDSGITHIAATLAVPSLVLWGPSRSEIWRPLGPRVHILHAPNSDLAQLSISTVQATLANLLTSAAG